jgi:hypothetical protein
MFLKELVSCLNRTGILLNIFVIVILREDPLSMGILEMIFENIVSCDSFSRREFIYLNFRPNITASTRTIRVEAGSSIPYLVWKLASFFSQY